LNVYKAASLFVATSQPLRLHKHVSATLQVAPQFEAALIRVDERTVDAGVGSRRRACCVCNPRVAGKV
jgi:hypothetical protein